MKTRRRRVGSKTCRRRRHRKRRGGSTTEQIGAATQMRHFLPDSGSQMKIDLNAIVHHEDPYSRFHDTSFPYNPVAQRIIDDAHNLIDRHGGTSHTIKEQMSIARQKAQDSSIPRFMPQPTAPSSVDAAGNFPALPVIPRPPQVVPVAHRVEVAHVITPGGIVYQHQHNPQPDSARNVQPTQARIDPLSTASLNAILGRR
jgi:hypothetical protein